MISVLMPQNMVTKNAKNYFKFKLVQVDICILFSNCIWSKFSRENNLNNHYFEYSNFNVQKLTIYEAWISTILFNNFFYFMTALHLHIFKQKNMYWRDFIENSYHLTEYENTYLHVYTMHFGKYFCHHTNSHINSHPRR